MAVANDSSLGECSKDDTNETNITFSFLWFLQSIPISISPKANNRHNRFRFLHGFWANEASGFFAGAVDVQHCESVQQKGYGLWPMSSTLYLMVQSTSGHSW